MSKSKMQLAMIFAGMFLWAPLMMSASTGATETPAKQAQASESQPTSQPVQPQPDNAGLSLWEERVVDILAAASMKLDHAKGKAREFQPKIKVAIKEAKDSESGKKVMELARAARTKAQELAKTADEKRAAVATYLERDAKRTAGEAERIKKTVSTAKNDADTLKAHIPTSQPTEAYYKALWKYRLLRSKQAFLKARAACEDTTAAALKKAEAKGETDTIDPRQRASPRREGNDKE